MIMIHEMEFKLFLFYFYSTPLQADSATPLRASYEACTEAFNSAAQQSGQGAR